MLGRESFQEYDDRLFEVLSPFYKNVLKSKFHKYNRVYGNIEVNTDKCNKHSVSKHGVSDMIYDEYSFDVISNSKRGLFTKTVKFTDLYYKKIRVSDNDIDRGKFDGIGEYVYSVILMGFNLDGKFEGGKGYWVDERLFKDLSGKFEFRESILEDWKEKKVNKKINKEMDDVKRKERLEENKRKWDSGIFSKYEFFLREEDMEYLLKGIFEDKIEKERIRVWCDGEDMGEDKSEDMGEENDVEDGDGMEGVEIDFFSEPLGIKEIKRVKPCAFVQKIILGLDEGCNWAGYCEDGMRLDGDERTVLRFDREGFPLEQDEERQEII